MKVLIIDGVESSFIADRFIIQDSGDYVGITGDFEVAYPKSALGGSVIAIADYTPPPPVIDPPAPEVRHITKLAFRNRFTMKEKVAIELAGNINPNDPAQKQQLAATVCASNADVAASAYIDLDRPDTRDGVKLMEDFGLLAAGRAAEILDNPVQEFERYNG